MGYIGLLERGSKYIMFDASGQYKLAPGFSPPTIALAPSMANGTSASNYGDSLLVGERKVSQQVSIPFRMTASSALHMEWALSDVNTFLRGAGDENEPTYFSFRADDSTSFEPYWGQGSRRMKISNGSARFGSRYGEAALSSRALPDCTMDLLVVGIEGKPQVFGFAKGGVYEDKVGCTSGISRGLFVSAAVTNETLNPVFGNATYATGWSVGAGLMASKNTDERYIYPGASASMKVIAIAAAGNGITFSINTADTNTHAFSAYLMKPDGSAVTASDVTLYYNASLTTTVKHIGGGVYVAYATATGISGAVSCGVFVTNGVTLFVMGFQMEEAVYASELCWGDHLGAAWAGTAHNSASTRPAGMYKIPVANSINLDQGSVSMIWRPRVSAADSPSEYPWCTLAATGLIAIFNATDNKLYLQDGTNSIATAALTHAAYDYLHLTFTWKQGAGLNIYLNGANAATGATYTPPSVAGLGDYLYIGSTEGTTFHATGTFPKFVTYDRALTTAQALAVYNQDAPLIAAGKPVGTIPYLWTIDGDGVIDDITDADQAAYAVAGGIAGDVPSSPYALFDVNITAATSIFGSFYDADQFIYQNDFYESKTTSVTNSSVEIFTQTIPPQTAKLINGRKLYVYVVATDAGTGTLSTVASIDAYNFTFISSRTAVIDPDPSFETQFIYTGLSFPNVTTIKIDPDNSSANYVVKVNATRSAASAANVVVRGVLVFGGAFVVNRSDEHMAIYDGRAFSIDDFSAARVGIYPYAYIGDTLQIVPNKINHLFWANRFGDWTPGGVVLNKMIYTPRYLNA